MRGLLRYRFRQYSVAFLCIFFLVTKTSYEFQEKFSLFQEMIFQNKSIVEEFNFVVEKNERKNLIGNWNLVCQLYLPTQRSNVFFLKVSSTNRP